MEQNAELGSCVLDWRYSGGECVVGVLKRPSHAERVVLPLQITCQSALVRDLTSAAETRRHSAYVPRGRRQESRPFSAHHGQATFFSLGDTHDYIPMDPCWPKRVKLLRPKHAGQYRRRGSRALTRPINRIPASRIFS